MEKMGTLNRKGISYYVFLDENRIVWWSRDSEGGTKNNRGQIDSLPEHFGSDKILAIAEEMLEGAGY